MIQPRLARHDELRVAHPYTGLLVAHVHQEREQIACARFLLPPPRLEQVPGVKVLTSYDPKQSCGLASFTPGALDVNKLVTYLWDKYKIIVTPIVHPEFNCIRVTPNVYTLADEVDRFAEVVEDAVRKGIPV